MGRDVAFRGRGFVLALACALLFPALTSAQSLTTRPYQLHVVLDFAENRVLTPTFQQRVQQQLRAFLRLHYRSLCDIRLDFTHPRLEEVRVKGLHALDGWDEISSERTVFVLMDFDGGRYHLQVRQQDGWTGLVTPAVRRDSTSSPEEVARLAARLIDQDFGPCGTIERVEGNKVTLALQGGELSGASIGRWIGVGDVVGVTRLEKLGDRVRPVRLEWAALVVREAPVKGRVVCDSYQRYQEDQLAVSDNFRCLKLATVTAPLHLRFVGQSPEDALEKVQVQIGKGGYERNVRDVALDAAGWLRTETTFPGIAFLRVRSGAAFLAQFPVVLVDEQPQVVPISVKPEAVTRGQLLRQVERWELAVLDELQVADVRVRHINAVLERSQDEALREARTGQQHLEEMERLFRRQQSDLQTAASKAGVTIEIHSGQQRLHDLRERHEVLKKFGEELEKAIKEARSEKTLEAQRQLARAALLEKQAEYEQAIVAYKRVLELRPDQGKIEQHLRKLEQQWQTKNTEHKAARQFIYSTWTSKLDAAGLRANFEKLKKAIAICQQSGDRLTPRMFLLANVAHRATLTRRLEILRRHLANEDSRAETKALTALVEELGRLHEQMFAFVKGTEKK